MTLPIDHARLPKPGDTFSEKYRLECILGSGGMGVVYGATHLITHKRVAIKWLAGDLGNGSASSDITQRFVREARLAGEFHHPNVVQVYDLGESDGSFYMVMEWLEGESLLSRLERVGRLPFEEAIDCLIPCMHALQRAHDAGIIHRDIKPANIFLCDATADRPAISKVLDFGISKRVTDRTDMTSFVTKTGVLIGTPHYLAPEQLRARPVDRRTDVYGFGVLLYQTLAGDLPFTADNFGDLVVEISVGTPRSLREHVPDLPLGVEHIVARAMARDPEQRFASLHELVASLEATNPLPLTAATMPQLRTPSSLRPIATQAQPLPEPRARITPRLLLVGAALGALAAGAGVMLHERSTPRHDEPSAIVRPRQLTQTASADTEAPAQPILQPAPVALPAAGSLAALAPGAAIDEGRAVPVEPVPKREPPKAAEPKVAEPTDTSAKPKQPALQARVPAKPAAPAPAPTEPQPPAATPAAPPEATPQPAPEAPKHEHNPLHMNIQ
jgi:eukaryotic-like serine/threonine-protein kinase